MVRLTFILEGSETISTEDLAERPGDPVERVMLMAVRNHIQRRLGDLFCPRHGQSPRIIATGPSPDRLAFSVEGCCEKLTARAARALDGEETRSVGSGDVTQ
jgi:hypothetical protein